MPRTGQRQDLPAEQFRTKGRLFHKSQPLVTGSRGAARQWPRSCVAGAPQFSPKWPVIHYQWSQTACAFGITCIAPRCKGIGGSKAHDCPTSFWSCKASFSVSPRKPSASGNAHVWLLIQRVDQKNLAAVALHFMSHCLCYISYSMY